MTDNEAPVSVAVQFSGTTIKAPDYKVAYCNTLRMGAGPYDIQMMFGAIRERNGPEDQVVEEQMLIIVSPQHAKAMFNSLRITIETYETNFGVIPDAAAGAAVIAAAAKNTT